MPAGLFMIALLSLMHGPVGGGGGVVVVGGPAGGGISNNCYE